MVTRHMVTLSSTGPDGVVIEVQVSGPDGYSTDALRARLAAATHHVVVAYETGAPVDVEVGEAWLTARVLR